MPPEALAAAAAKFLTSRTARDAFHPAWSYDGEMRSNEEWPA